MGVEEKTAHWTQLLLLEQTTVAGVKKHCWGVMFMGKEKQQNENRKKNRKQKRKKCVPFTFSYLQFPSSNPATVRV